MGQSGSSLCPTQDRPNRSSGGSSDPLSISDGVGLERSNLCRKMINSVETVHSEKSSQKYRKNLKYFDQKLTRKILLPRILVKFWLDRLRRVLEERTCQQTHQSWFLGFVTHQSSQVDHGWILTGSSRLG